MKVPLRLSPYAAAVAMAASVVVRPAGAQHALEEVVVTASARDQAAADIAQSVTVLRADALDRVRAGSIGETLEGQLGLSASYFGIAASRPIIRGLAGARVRTMEDGIESMDLATVSADHAVSIEPLVARQIEVFRGPTTLLYGSGAVGGVVNTVTNRIPAGAPEGGFAGALELRADTVADERTGAVALDGGREAFAWHVDAATRGTGDYEIPGFAGAAHDDAAAPEQGRAGAVANSDLELTSYALGGALHGGRGSFGAAVSGFEMQYGVPGHEHADADERVRIDLEQTRLDLSAGWSGGGVIEAAQLRIGVNDYAHIELESGRPGTRFENDQYEARLELLPRPHGRWSGTFGVQLGERELSALGAEAFVPPVDSASFGIFALEQAELERWSVSFGARVETQSHDPSADETSVDGTAASFSAAAVRDLGRDRSITVNLASAERLPAAEELYARGPHLASGAVEIGEPTLRAETSRHLDLGIRRETQDLRWAVTAFATEYADFIFLRDTGAIDAQEELPIFVFAQRDAEFRGVEAEIFGPVASVGAGELDVRLFADYVEAELEGGENVPRIPPMRYGVRLQYHAQMLAAGIEATHYTDQTDTAPFEEPTAGYTLVGADLQWNVSLGGGVDAVLFVRGANLLDENARRHASLIKQIAPLPGRNVTLGIRALF